MTTMLISLDSSLEFDKDGLRLRGVRRYRSFSFISCHIVGSLLDREVACSASDCQGPNFESYVWRAMSSHWSHHPQEVLLAQISLLCAQRWPKASFISFHIGVGRGLLTSFVRRFCQMTEWVRSHINKKNALNIFTMWRNTSWGCVNVDLTWLKQNWNWRFQPQIAPDR